MADRRRYLKTALLVLWYIAIAFLAFLLHNFPDGEFRYWRM